MNVEDSLFLLGLYNRSHILIVSNKKTIFQKFQQDFKFERCDFPAVYPDCGWLLTIIDDVIGSSYIKKKSYISLFRFFIFKQGRENLLDYY